MIFPSTGTRLVSNNENDLPGFTKSDVDTMINSFRTESRSQRLGLRTVAYRNPLTAALHK